MDPPPQRRLPAPPRSHGRRARLLRGRCRPGRRRAAADPRRRRRRRGRLHRRARPVRRRAGRARARPVRPVVRPPLLRRAPLPRRPARPAPPRVRRRHAARRRAAGRAAHRAGGVAGDHGPAAPAGAAVDGALHARHRVARRHVDRGDAVALAAAHPRHARRAAGRRDRHDPVPPVAVPGHVVGAAAGGGRRAAGGGDRHRRAGGQGLRPGGAGGRHAGGPGPPAVRRAHARGPDDRAAQPGAAGAADPRAGRRDRYRRGDGALRVDLARYLPRLRHLRQPARRAGSDDRRAGGQRAAGAGRRRAGVRPRRRPAAGHGPAGPGAGCLRARSRSSWTACGSVTRAASRCSTG